jgi:hypothetical protein
MFAKQIVIVQKATTQSFHSCSIASDHPISGTEENLLEQLQDIIELSAFTISLPIRDPQH